MGQVGIARETLQCLVGGDPRLLHVGQRGIELRVLAAAAEAYLIVLMVSRLEKKVFPVGPLLDGIAAFVIAYSRLGSIVLDILLCKGLRIGFTHAFLVECEVLEAEGQQRTTVVTAQHGTIVDGKVGETPVAAEVDMGLALLAALRRDDDHAVGGTRTVQ